MILNLPDADVSTDKIFSLYDLLIIYWISTLPFITEQGNPKVGLS